MLWPPSNLPAISSLITHSPSLPASQDLRPHVILPQLSFTSNPLLWVTPKTRMNCIYSDVHNAYAQPLLPSKDFSIMHALHIALNGALMKNASELVRSRTPIWIPVQECESASDPQASCLVCEVYSRWQSDPKPTSPQIMCIMSSPIAQRKCSGCIKIPQPWLHFWGRIRCEGASKFMGKMIL
jgi:hypothetical protein